MIGSRLRLNRAIALTGCCSRRQADALIKQGRVSINGQTIKNPSTLIDFRHQQLAVDGQCLRAQNYIHIMLYKPKGVITTCADEKKRRSVLDLLPAHLQHLKPAGRLDRDSEGLLLMSNDGSLIKTITSPSSHVLKRYRVEVFGPISEKELVVLSQGMQLREGLTRPAVVQLIATKTSHSCLEITISEGKNRQIRRMLASCGLTVLRLVRVGVGALQLSGLRPGAWRHLSDDEVRLLTKAIPRAKAPI